MCFSYLESENNDNNAKHCVLCEHSSDVSILIIVDIEERIGESVRRDSLRLVESVNTH
jgi:hypothetical protein